MTFSNALSNLTWGNWTSSQIIVYYFNIFESKYMQGVHMELRVYIEELTLTNTPITGLVNGT